MDFNARNVNRDLSYKILRKNFVIIKENIDSEDFIDLMFQEGYLELDEKKHIQQLSKQTEQNETLLTHIFKSSEKHRVFFLEQLKSKYSNLYSYFKIPGNSSYLPRGPSRADSDTFSLKGANGFNSRANTSLSLNQVSFENCNTHENAERCHIQCEKNSRNPTVEESNTALKTPRTFTRPSLPPISNPSVGNISQVDLRIGPKKCVVPPITGRSRISSNTVSPSELNSNQAAPTISSNEVSTSVTDSKIIQCSSFENKFPKLPGIPQKSFSPTAQAVLLSSKSFYRGLSQGTIKTQSGTKVPKDKRSMVKNDNEHVVFLATFKSITIAPLPKTAKHRKSMPFKKFKKKNTPRT